jgi:hypothetical protein
MGGNLVGATSRAHENAERATVAKLPLTGLLVWSETGRSAFMVASALTIGDTEHRPRRAQTPGQSGNRKPFLARIGVAAPLRALF